MTKEELDQMKADLKRADFWLNVQAACVFILFFLSIFTYLCYQELS